MDKLQNFSLPPSRHLNYSDVLMVANALFNEYVESERAIRKKLIFSTPYAPNPTDPPPQSVPQTTIDIFTGFNQLMKSRMLNLSHKEASSSPRDY